MYSQGLFGLAQFERSEWDVELVREMYNNEGLSFYKNTVESTSQPP